MGDNDSERDGRWLISEVAQVAGGGTCALLSVLNCYDAQEMPIVIERDCSVH